MKIDVISYTESQFTALSEEQILKVQSAQLKKNRLAAALEDDLKEAKHRLVKNNTFLSSLWEQTKKALQTRYEQEVENIRDGLLFYLRYSSPNGSAGVEPPYIVDYSLTETERFTIVKNYYQNKYSDAEVRFRAFKDDALAKTYLGEMYAPLYDYFLDASKA